MQTRALQIKGPYTDKGSHGQGAHTDKGPLQTKDPYRRCVIPTDKGHLERINLGPLCTIKGPYDN